MELYGQKLDHVGCDMFNLSAESASAGPLTCCAVHMAEKSLHSATPIWGNRSQNSVCASAYGHAFHLQQRNKANGCYPHNGARASLGSRPQDPRSTKTSLRQPIHTGAPFLCSFIVLE